MNIRHLEFLCSVVEQASFTKAAVRHGVSQAAITLAMQGLERDLGVQGVGKNSVGQWAALR